MEQAKTTTADALLGLLSLGAMSGYQLRQLIDESIGNFWTESYGQIYPTLKKLVVERMVTAKVEARSGKAERTVYSLTTAGRRRVHDWLQIPAQMRPPRHELLLKLFFSGMVSHDVAKSQVETFRTLQYQRIARYEATARETESRYAKHPDLPFWLITVRYGLYEAQALVKWADETLHTLDRLPRAVGPALVKTKVTRKGGVA